MSENDAVRELSDIARELTGVQLSERHSDMVKSRLLRRITELGLLGLQDYLGYYRNNRSTEAPKLISLLTTHHTYFFREFGQFEYLLEKALPALREEILNRPDRTLRLWSAACSRGQEVYSLAMFLELHLPRMIPGARYEILGTDVDPESVMIAKNGVYHQNDLKEVPISLMSNHWSKGTGEIKQFVRANTSLRSHCKFAVGNLLSGESGAGPEAEFDLVFCRNVFIYFNAEQIKKISESLITRLHPQGFLFVGISESLSQLKLPLGNHGPSVYRHASVSVRPASHALPAPAPAAIKREKAAPVAPRLTRVLCVDDSPIILTLLKKMLTQKDGFEVVGTAVNGLDAAEKRKTLRPDIMTLDIHMPEQTGIEYLKHNFGPHHPPVVMVSSVSRDQADLAGQALSGGASDYVEKPALNNLDEKGDEIRTKLRCALQARKFATTPKKSDPDLFSGATGKVDPDACLRLVLFNLSSRAAVASTLRELTGPQPPCILLVDGAKDALTGIAAVLSRDLGKPVSTVEQLTAGKLSGGAIILSDLNSQFEKIKTIHAKGRRLSVLVYGDVSQGGARCVSELSGSHLLLEDLGGGKGTAALTEIANEIVPATSFAYVSSQCLSESKEDKAA